MTKPVHKCGLYHKKFSGETFFAFENHEKRLAKFQKKENSGGTSFYSSEHLINLGLYKDCLGESWQNIEYTIIIITKYINEKSFNVIVSIHSQHNY